MADFGDRPDNQNGSSNVAVPDPRAMVRPFSLREALPYAPLTATVPYLPDYVPEPSIGFGNPAPALTDLFDSSQYDAINQEASAAPAGHSTRQVRHAIDSILHDLRPMARTHYKFRAPSMDMLPVTKPAPPLTAAISPLARAVHEKFGALIKRGWDPAALPTPAPVASSDGLAAVPPPSLSGRPPTINGARAEGPSAAAAAATAPPLSPSPPAAANVQAYHHNSAIEIKISPHKAFEQASLEARAAATPPPPTLQPEHLHSASTKSPPSRRPPPSPSTPIRAKHTPTKPKPFPGSWTISVELGNAPINKDEFIEIDVADLPDLPHKNLSRRKHNPTDYQTLLATSLDQQQSRQAALSEFATITREINEAIAHARQPSQGPDPDLAFTSDGEPTLRAAMHQKVQTLIHKMIDLGAFDQVPLDDLLQHLKLCENTLQQQTDVSYQPEELWQESEIESWAYQLSEVEVGLKAARTALRIMSGNRKERQLYSEHIIQLCLVTFKEAINRIVIPIVELRSGSPLFRRLTPHKKAIGSVFTACQRVYAVIASVISTVNLSSTITGPLEFEASRLMFVENGLHEKDSVVGVQKFDGIRLVAMDMLCQIFRIKVETRAGLLNELFSSIEKMPIGRHSARQFKLTGGGSIQPVSALVMRLIQASATMVRGSTGTDEMEVAAGTPPWREGEGGRELDHLASADQSYKCEIKHEDMAAASVESSLNSLQAVTTELVNAARNNADHVVHLLVRRAMSATKSGDAPYRNLLDQFVDDFTLCLGSPDWPAAELILCQLNSRFIQLITDEKSSAPCKNMALELMGTIGAAISKLRLHVRKTIGSAALAGDTDDVGRIFSELARSALQQVMTTEQLVSWEGPYRATVEYLLSRCSDDPYLTGAISLIVAEWSEKACRGYDSLGSENRDRDDQFGRLAYRLGMMVKDPAWLSASHEFDTVSDGHARLAYAVTLIQSRLFESFSRILNLLLSSMDSDQATVRNKSLKSINQMIETDPSILQDTNSILTQLTIRCDGDSSTQVRDSALTLIGKCLLMLPQAESRLIDIVTGKFQDSTVGIRKRAMKLARDAYLRNSDPSIRIKIAQQLLTRALDHDETVRDLARQMIEEIWFAPFYGAVADAAATGKDAAYRTALGKHIAVMVPSIGKVSQLSTLDRIFRAIINEQPQQGPGQQQQPQQSASQQSQQNPLQVQSQPAQAGRPVTRPFAVCAELVAALFEIVNQGGDPKPGHILYMPSGRGAFKVLMLLSRAEPGLFTFEQIKLLQPHLNINMGSQAEEVAIFRAVSAIYRHVLPRLSAGTHSQFLTEVRFALGQVLGRVPISATEDLVVCMWIISNQLLQDLNFFGRIVASSVDGVRSNLENGLEGSNSTAAGGYRLQRFITVTGMAGRYCNELKIEMTDFSRHLPDWRAGHLSEFLIKSVMPAANSTYITPVRLSSLNAIGLICQSAPHNFVDPIVYKIFQDVFDQRNPELESSVLRSFQSFLISEEQRAEAAQEPATTAAGAADNNTTISTKKTSTSKKTTTASSNNRRSAAAAAAAATTAATVVASKRKLAVMGGTSHEQVSVAITQRFIPQFKRIAMSSQTADALVAVELLASISRQGLVHPTETTTSFLVLETSTHPRISELALQEHRAMHQKFETALERDYAKAVQEVFAYQRDIVKDLRGATTNPFRAKLHLIAEVIRISAPRKRHAFYNRLCRRLEFDPAKLDVGDGSVNTIPDHVLMSRFIIDNLIFFEYQSIGEVMATAATMEKMVVLIGNPLAHRLESELFKAQTGVGDAAAELDRTLQYPTPARETSASSVASPVLADVGPVRLRQLASGAVILYALWEARTYLRRLYGLDSNRRDGKAKAAGKDNSKPPVKVQGIHGDKIWDEIEHITTVGLQSTAAMVERCQAFVDLINIDSEFKLDAERDDDMVDMVDIPTTPSDSGRADVADEAPEPGSGRGRKRKAPGSATPASGRKKQARSSSKPLQPPRPRGRPRKNPLPPPPALPSPRQSGEQESPGLE